MAVSLTFLLDQGSGRLYLAQTFLDNERRSEIPGPIM